MSQKIYQMITNQIIRKLEQGVVPWKQPFVNGIAVNWKTQRAYRGINTMLLDGGEYATFNQIKEAGGKVRKGAKSQTVVFWKIVEVEDRETEEEKTIPLLRYFRVFDVGSQVEGLKPKRQEETFNHDPIAEAEEIKQAYADPPSFSFARGRACYIPLEDRVNVPSKGDFEDIHQYYSTLFHEMVHSTGHQRRLARPGVTTQGVAFGNEVYSKEELVAEMGAAMLSSVAGIDHSTVDNSASYIHSWLRALKDDHRLVIQAAAQAQKVADYILGVSTGQDT